VHVVDAERLRVGLPGAAQLPGAAAGDELVARYVERARALAPSSMKKRARRLKSPAASE